MRYLLLSVLVVCVIGIMVPSVFAYHNKEIPCHDSDGNQLECPLTDYEAEREQAYQRLEDGIDAKRYAYTLPPGVKSPAPSFESEFSKKYTHFDTYLGLTVGELYSYWDYELNGGFIKIVSGEGKDLLRGCGTRI